MLFFVVRSIFAQGIQPTVSANDLEMYEKQSKNLVSYLEDTFNFLGNPNEPISAKEIIINESYNKVFENDKVQIEDDLDENRRVPLYKNVQAYMKDIMFFYKKVSFTFDITSVEQLVNQAGQIYYKVSFNRRLQGVTVNNDTVDNLRIRYMEVNLNATADDLKIASIYTTKPNQNERLRQWWNGMSIAWKNYFGKSIIVYDTLPFNMIRMFTDSTIVTPVWNSVIITDTILLAKPDTLHTQPHPLAADSLNDRQISLRSNAVFEKFPDTLKANATILFKILRHLIKISSIDISNNLMIKNLQPLRQLSKLQTLNISHTLINNIAPLHSLSKLEKLNLSASAVSDLNPLKYIWKLHEIDFSHTEIKDIAVLAGLKQIEILKMDSNEIPEIVPVNHHKNLRLLQAANCHITSIDSISALPSLTRLDLHGNPLQQIDSLRKLTAIQQLNLDSTAVSDLKPLAELHNLSVLQINNTAVADLSPIENLEKLKVVYCDNSLVTQAEADRFMTVNPSILVVYNSAKLEKWWTKLSARWKTVFKQNISKPKKPTKEELHKLINVTSLNLSPYPEIKNLKPLKILYRLDELNISGTAVSDIDALASLSQLNILKMNFTKVSSLFPLSKLHNLKRLSCNNTGVSDLLPLSGNKRLNTVFCDDAKVKPQTVDALLDNLPECLVVFETENLRIWWNNIDTTWQKAFRKILETEEQPTTQSLHRLAEKTILQIKNMPKIDDLEALSVFFRLRKLSLENVGVTDIAPLVSLPELLELSITNCSLADLTGIEKLTQLQSLTLSNTAINDIYLLANLKQLKKLDISGTRIKNLKYIRNLTGLETLIINNTRVKSLKFIMPFQNLKLLKCYNTSLTAKRVKEFKQKHPQTKVVFY